MVKDDGVLREVTNEDIKLLETNPEEFWEGVTEIGECAFFKCNYLENVTIGSNITTIRKRAFYECISMEKIVIPNNVLVIESK